MVLGPDRSLAGYQDLSDEEDRKDLNISCVIAAYGEEKWHSLARDRALPSTEGHGFLEVIVSYLPGGTLAEARNAGAAAAKGEWLLFLDADDELEPGFGRALEVAMRGYGPSMMFTPSVRYVRPGRTQSHTRIWPRMDIRDGNWLIIGTAIAKRVFDEIGGFREYGWSEDWALFAEAIERGCEVVEVPDAIYRAYVNLKSRNRSKHHKEMLYWHQRIGADIWPNDYEQPTEEEDRRRRLLSHTVRRVRAAAT